MFREDSEQAESEALACIFPCFFLLFFSHRRNQKESQRHCRERELALQAEEVDLRRAQEEFKKKIEDIEREHDLALQPTLLQVKIDTSDLHSQNDDSIAKIKKEV